MTFVWCFFITLLGAFCAWVKELSSVFSTELTCKTASDREYPCRHLVHCLQEALKWSWMIFWMCLWKKKCGGAGILFRGLFRWARKQLNCVDYLFTHTLFYTTWVLPYGFQSLSFMSTWKQRRTPSAGGQRIWSYRPPPSAKPVRMNSVKETLKKR